MNQAVRPPSGMTSVTPTPFGANSGGNSNSMAGIGGQGGLFGVSGTGGLFSGTKTPPRPVSGFTSVGSSGICFGQNNASSIGKHYHRPAYLKFFIFFTSKTHRHSII